MHFRHRSSAQPPPTAPLISLHVWCALLPVPDKSYAAMCAAERVAMREGGAVEAIETPSVRETRCLLLYTHVPKSLKARITFPI
jgi:hypothetical protein